ncbi:putative UDP-glucuronate:xylan alpha-glucuronosyltransferase 4 [Coffea eugenioides]|uniref:putative UDP-glucuronate:xylan alpha-glucuronosyltransferase 4 n=1 Tax=Coffea eugenioides TaxID=49369 RepID=UPI000F60CCE1|nr:putative UDP-glucuronate:xylan alpha-glucuronosyltransferase 4 [Coffea eugenioides]
MGSKPSKRKPFTTLSLTFLSLTLMLIIFRSFRWKIEVPRKNINSISVRYPEWYRMIAQELAQKRIRVGLVNVNNETSEDIGSSFMQGEAEIVKVNFDRAADHIQWGHLFPEWIDEDNPEEQKCPEIPMPRYNDYGEFDVIVASIPCPIGWEKGMGIRDVFRLQVNLVVANLLVRSSFEYHEDKMKFVVFLGSCSPMWEIFRCDDLFWDDGAWSIYMPDLRRLKQKVLMPVGTCQLAHPFAESGQEGWRRYALNDALYQPREAYVTILHSSEAYVCGAIALAQSIIQSNSSKDLVLLADDSISKKSLQGLEAAGWKIKRIKRIRSPHAAKGAYNEWNYSKLRIWRLIEYDKIIFIDSDFIVLRSLDEFFVYPQLSAVGNNGHIFNSGLMLVEPSKCAFQAVMGKRFTMASYNGGDQGFLNEVFTWWHRWPGRVNFLKFFGDSYDLIRPKIPMNLYTIHYLGVKPWMCYKDYDCNWDMVGFHKFASDLAHEKWWQVYDAMPKKLRPYCELSPRMDARIKKWRGKAKNASLPDRHWEIRVKDPRMHA